jgi:hypothetical protein
MPCCPVRTGHMAKILTSFESVVGRLSVNYSPQSDSVIPAHVLPVSALLFATASILTLRAFAK